MQSTEAALENIKQFLITGFGLKVKKKAPVDAVEQFKETALSGFTWTTVEKEAWLAAGMPEPRTFLKEYRRGN